jgi:hypothetical protein
MTDEANVTVTLPKAEAEDVIRALEAGMNPGPPADTAPPTADSAAVADETPGVPADAPPSGPADGPTPQPEPEAPAADPVPVNPAPTPAEIATAAPADVAPQEVPTAPQPAPTDTPPAAPVEVQPVAPPVTILPTPGRIVWYRSRRDDGVPPAPNDAPLGALLAGINRDETVNLAVFGFDGSLHPKQNVVLVQDGEPLPGQCGWMPYQKAMAAKATPA